MEWLVAYRAHQMLLQNKIEGLRQSKKSEEGGKSIAQPNLWGLPLTQDVGNQGLQEKHPPAYSFVTN
jgi:hypothetical protein